MGVEALALPNYVLFMVICTLSIVAATRLMPYRESQFVVTVLMCWTALSIGGWFLYLAYEDPTFSIIGPVAMTTLLGSLAALWIVRHLSLRAAQQ